MFESLEMDLEVGSLPEPPVICPFCQEFVAIPYYVLKTKGYRTQVFLFDEECFNHVLVMGWKFIGLMKEEIKN
jgi:hypothetical protein